MNTAFEMEHGTAPRQERAKRSTFFLQGPVCFVTFASVKVSLVTRRPSRLKLGAVLVLMRLASSKTRVCLVWPRHHCRSKDSTASQFWRGDGDEIPPGGTRAYSSSGCTLTWRGLRSTIHSSSDPQLAKRSTSSYPPSANARFHTCRRVASSTDASRGHRGRSVEADGCSSCIAISKQELFFPFFFSAQRRYCNTNPSFTTRKKPGSAVRKNQ